MCAERVCSTLWKGGAYLWVCLAWLQEIGAYAWHYIHELPASGNEADQAYLASGGNRHRFFMVGAHVCTAACVVCGVCRTLDGPDQTCSAVLVVVLGLHHCQLQCRFIAITTAWAAPVFRHLFESGATQPAGDPHACALLSVVHVPASAPASAPHRCELTHVFPHLHHATPPGPQVQPFVRKLRAWITQQRRQLGMPPAPWDSSLSEGGADGGKGGRQRKGGKGQTQPTPSAATSQMPSRRSSVQGAPGGQSMADAAQQAAMRPSQSRPQLHEPQQPAMRPSQSRPQLHEPQQVAMRPSQSKPQLQESRKPQPQTQNPDAPNLVMSASFRFDKQAILACFA